MKTEFSLSAFIKSFGTPHPARDWMMLLAFVALIFVAFAGYAGYMFYDVRWGDISNAGDNAPPPKPAVTKAQLDAQIQAYQARQDAFEARNYGLPKLSDPAQ